MPASSDCAASVRSTALRDERLYPAMPQIFSELLGMTLVLFDEKLDTQVS
jgi:hypothetical protein